METERERVRLISTSSLPKYPQWLCLGQAESRSLKLNPGICCGVSEPTAAVECTEPTAGAITGCLLSWVSAGC